MRLRTGYAEWEGTDKEQCLLYWRKPVEWADMIAQRVRGALAAASAAASAALPFRPFSTTVDR